MLNPETIGALHRLVKVKGLVQGYRVDTVRDLLSAMPETPCDAPEIVSQALQLAAPGDPIGNDVVALVTACQGNPEATAHAKTLLDVMVMVSEDRPAGRKSRRSGPASFDARVVGA
jgi:hypothetical protein